MKFLKQAIIFGIISMVFLTSCAKPAATEAKQEEAAEPAKAEEPAAEPAKAEEPAAPTPAPTPEEPPIEKMTISFNDHTYDYDVVSAATLEAPVDEEAIIPVDEKLGDMYWSGRPSLGFIKGDYYSTRTYYTKRSPQPYIADIEIVKDGNDIKMVEFNEWCVEDYSDQHWANYSKRLSGYAQFQAENPRTDTTFMTWVNGATLIEYQMVNEDRLTGDFKSIHGSSNSMRFGFIPLVRGMAEKTNEPSGQYYYSLTTALSDGMFARVAVIKEGDKIVGMEYDEYFDDIKENIKPEDMQQFFRQSKYYSRTYAEVTGRDFQAFSKGLSEQVIKAQDLLAIADDANFATECANYKTVAQQLLDEMKK